MVLMLQTLASLLIVMTRDTGHIYLFQAPSSKRSLCKKFTHPPVPPKLIFRVLPRDLHHIFTPRMLAPPQPAQRSGKVSRKNALLASLRTLPTGESAHNACSTKRSTCGSTSGITISLIPFAIAKYWSALRPSAVLIIPCDTSDKHQRLGECRESSRRRA